jgi:hypothetical protein
LASAPAGAQEGEFDRQLDPAAESERLRGQADEDEAGDEAGAEAEPEDPKFIPEPGVDPSRFPAFEPPPQRPEEAPSLWETIDIDLELRGRVAGGHDTNVFRADRGRSADAYVRGQGELDLAARLENGVELLFEVSGETMLYGHFHKADEHFLSSFAEVFVPVTGWLDVGLQNALEYSKQNLLDDNGDLFPRGRFGSVDEEPRVYAIYRPRADLGVEVGASFRHKDYEENEGVESLDYQELRFDAAVSYKLSKQPRSRLKLRYRLRRRDYRQLRARARDGGLASDSPHLDLLRHQLSLSWYQELRLADWLEARVIAGVGYVYNQDTFQNDRSYRQLSASLRVEWWILPDLTRLEVGLISLGRNFLVRQPLGRGGHLRHRLLDLQAEIWQRLGDLPLAVFAAASVSVWRSGDPQEDYDRYLLEGGLELFW